MRIALLVLLPSCGQLLGFTEPGVLDTPPTPTYSVSGRLQVRYADTAQNLAPQLIERPYRSDEVTLEVMLDDGTMPAVDYHDDGTFEFARTREHQPYRLRWSSRVASRELQSDEDTLVLADAFSGRIDFDPVTQPTLLLFRAGTLSGFAAVASTGIWSWSPSSMVNTANFDFDWNRSGSKPPGLGLLRADKNDRLYLLGMQQFPDSNLRPYTAIDSMRAYEITQSDGVPTTLTMPVQTVQRSNCLHLVALRRAAEAALAPTLQESTTRQSDWLVLAVPFFAPEGPLGVFLAYAGNSTIDDYNGMVTYANPFPSTQSIVTAGVSLVRTLTLPGGRTQMIPNQIRMVDLAPTGTSCETAVLESTNAVPATPTLGGVPLVTDDAMLVLPPVEDPDLSWDMVSPGTVDYTDVSLYEVTPSSGSFMLVQSAWTTGNTVKLERARLHRDATYIVRITTLEGFAHAGEGDMATLDLPYSYASVYSHTFHVTP